MPEPIDRINIEVVVDLVDLASGDANTVNAAITRALYPVMQAIFETGGEHRAKIGCHGHHAAQKACQAIVDQWVGYASRSRR